MKNITLSAPEALIEEARKKAAAKGTTLNNEFRGWLASQIATSDQRVANYKQMLSRLSEIDAGRTFSRDEMNER